MQFGEWLILGIENKWVSDPYCSMHDGAPLTDAEEIEIEETDICIPALRIWGDSGIT